MMASLSSSDARSGRGAFLVCVAAMLSLAVAMGIGRFAFTPLFPLMARDGLLDHEAGALLAASNYLGYLVGALLASQIRVKSETLLALGLISTVAVTAAVGATSSIPAWASLRFAAGVASAWTLVATSAWGLGWLAASGRSHMAGGIFAGVGLGIAVVGMFCLLIAGPEVSSLQMWLGLALLAAVAALVPLAASFYFPAAVVEFAPPVPKKTIRDAPSETAGLIACYTLFGFGYILPATYLPALARELVDDPQVFGWAWPVFGIAAALSTVMVSSVLKKKNRLRIWAASHLLMAIGVLLPIIWTSLASVAIAALLVGGTFMVITMLGLQEARSRIQGQATAILSSMTAGFAVGQLIGPILPVAIAYFTADYSTALNYALTASVVGLLASAFYLRREARRPNFH